MPKHLAEPVGGPVEPRRRRREADAARPAPRTTKAPTSTRYAIATRRTTAPHGRRPLAAVALVASAALVPVSFAMANAAQDDGVLAHDTFARSVAAGWGDATVGGAYTVSLPGSASVRDGAGLLAMRPAGTVSAVLRSVEAQDVDARATLAVDGKVGGNGLYASLMLRRQGNHDNYRVLARVARGGEVRLSILRVTGGSTSVLAAETGTGLVVAPGTAAVVEGVVTGTSPVVLKGRATVGARTSAWVTTADRDAARISGSGAIGISDYLSSASAPVTVRYSGLHALAVDPVAAPAQSPSTSAPTPGASPSPSEPSAPPSPPSPSTSTPSPTGSSPAPGGRAAARAGAAAPGGTKYAVPAGAVFVAPNGNDSATGSEGAPLRTLARALTTAASGGTVVLRGGSYHENVTVNKRVTVQAYPGEAVWLDGSSPVQGWSAAGGAWVHSGWTTTFDSTPCYNAGSCGTNDPSFQFIDPAHPMAAHPDQVFVDDVPQRQVGSAGEVGPGTFYVDYGSQRLYLGTDPNGHRVAASDLSEAITLRADGSALRGIGVRRYGTALPRMGTVRLTGAHQRLEQVTVVDNATTGIVATAAGAVLKNVTASRNGMLGVGANYADDLTVTGLRAEGNNAEHFKTAPVAGGIKVTRTRGVRIADGAFTNNDGTGVWLDESVYDASVTGSDITRNGSHGISFEISAKGLFADNVVTDNARDGMKINDSEGVRIWNNTLARNSRTIEVVQDARLASNRSNPGHDPRQAFPDPTMTWLVGKVSIGNNVLGHPRSGANCVLCVEDYSHKRSAAQMDVAEDGNVWTRAAASSPSWLFVWSTGAGNPAVFTTLDAFTRSTGQGRHSGDLLGGQPSPGARTALPATAQPLPADVAAALGRDAGEGHLGAWS